MLRVIAATLVLFAVAPLFAAEKEWTKYESKAGKFTTKFPGKPKDETKEIATAAGAMTVTTLSAVADKDLSVAVTYADYPPNFATLEAKKLLAAVRDGLKTKGASIVSENEVTDMNKFPGLEVQIDHGKYQTRSRLFLVGKRLYQVTATGSKEAVESKPAGLFLVTFESGK